MKRDPKLQRVLSFKVDSNTYEGRGYIRFQPLKKVFRWRYFYYWNSTGKALMKIISIKRIKTEAGVRNSKINNRLYGLFQMEDIPMTQKNLLSINNEIRSLMLHEQFSWIICANLKKGKSEFITREMQKTLLKHIFFRWSSIHYHYSWKRKEM